MRLVAKDSAEDHHLEEARKWIYKREGLERADFPDCCSYGPIQFDDPFKWRGVIFGPIGSPYQDGAFFVSIDLPYDYPLKPPEIKFKTKVCVYVCMYVQIN